MEFLYLHAELFDFKFQTLSKDGEQEIHSALKELCELLKEESVLSSYEVQSSGLVTSLFNCLNKVCSDI